MRTSRLVGGDRVVIDDEGEFMDAARKNKFENESAGLPSDSFCMVALYAEAQSLIQSISKKTGQNENQVIEVALRDYAIRISDESK